MKFRKRVFVGTVPLMMLALLTVVDAQTSNSPMDRAQMKKDIEIVEGVLNTVRQQSLATVMTAYQDKDADRNPFAVVYARTSDGRRSEGFYLNGYGVIFEVYVPNFSDQRTYRILAKKPGVANAGVGRGTSSEPFPRPSTAPTSTVSASVETSTAVLTRLSKLIETFTREQVSQGKDAALRQLASKLQELELVPQMKVMASSLFDEYSLSEKSTTDESRMVAERKEFQDSIIKAVASYGSTISQLQSGEFITVLLKAPVTQEFSLLSRDARTSNIIRFSVRDLYEFKVGKLSYAELLGKVKIEEN